MSDKKLSLINPMDFFVSDDTAQVLSILRQQIDEIKYATSQAPVQQHILQRPLEEKNVATPAFREVHREEPLSDKRPIAFRTGERVPSGDISISFVAPRLNPYQLAQMVAQKVPLFSSQHILYVYNDKFYKKTSADDAATIILDICRASISETGNAGLIRTVYNFLTTDSSFAQPNFQVNHRYLAFENCVLDLAAGTIAPHSPQILLTHALRCDCLSADQPTPVFDAFLSTCGCGDPIWITRAWEILGYVLVPDTSAKACFLFQGVPDSGKSLLCSLIRSFFSSDVVTALSVTELDMPFAASEAEGKMLVISPDLPQGPLKSVAVSNLKRFSGGDLVSAPKKYQNNREFVFSGTFVMATNHRFETRTPDEALENRIVTLPFANSIPKEAQDPQLLQRLHLERSAIARKALQAYFDLRKKAYRFAGDFQINEVCQEGDYPHQATTQLFESFLLKHFLPDPSGIVFLQDAHALFVKTCFFVPANSFGRQFGAAAKVLFGAQRHRCYRPGEGGNALSALKGIAFKLNE